MKKILILNCELGTQMQIYLALCDAYKIEIAEDIEAVMYYLRKMRPEIILLDYHLDESHSNVKTGLDLAKKLKKKYGDLKIMMLVDDEEMNFESEEGELIADGILHKPIKNSHLISNMRRLAATPNLA